MICRTDSACHIILMSGFLYEEEFLNPLDF